MRVALASTSMSDSCVPPTAPSYKKAVRRTSAWAASSFWPMQQIRSSSRPTTASAARATPLCRAHWPRERHWPSPKGRRTSTSRPSSPALNRRNSRWWRTATATSSHGTCATANPSASTPNGCVPACSTSHWSRKTRSPWWPNGSPSSIHATPTAASELPRKKRRNTLSLLNFRATTATSDPAPTPSP